MIPVTKTLAEFLIENHGLSAGGSASYYAHNAGQLLADGEMDPDDLVELTKGEEIDFYEDDDDSDLERLHEITKELKDMKNRRKSSPTPDDLFDGDDGDSGGYIRVKGASERLSTKRWTAKNRMGQTVEDPIYGGEITHPSQADHYKVGVLFKHMCRKHGAPPLSEYERNLLDEMCEREKWVGLEDKYDNLGPKSVKALIDDSASGGLEIAPIWFDQDVYSVPFLTGELFPLVDVREVPRGRRVEGASMTHPTVNWGGVDATSVSLFNTAGMVSAIDTTIHRCQTAIRIGRDLMDDSPVTIGSRVTGLIGEALSRDLDRVVSNGNGSTQPEGIFQKSGVTDINTDNSGSGPPTLDDYLTLLFTLAKQYRTRANRVVFISNDTTYQRSRAVKVDTATPSTDQRLVFDPSMQGQGNAVNAYQTLGWPHQIDNNLGNTVAAVCAMNRYRMYRRKGQEIRTSFEGDTLLRNNEILIVMFARYGGQLYDAAAAATWSDGQT
jgi:HK97 family phage major capsid protein